MNWKTTANMAALGLVLCGCAHESSTKAQLGDSVRHMTQQQFYNRDAAFNPDPAAVLGGDADRLNTVLESHRYGVLESTTEFGASAPDVRGRIQ